MIRCWLRFHEWTRWEWHPIYYRVVLRRCKTCGKRQTSSLRDIKRGYTFV